MVDRGMDGENVVLGVRHRDGRLYRLALVGVGLRPQLMSCYCNALLGTLVVMNCI